MNPQLRSRLIGRILFPIAFVAVALALTVNAPRAQATPAFITVVVNNLADTTHFSPCAGVSDDCTLRDAITIANGAIEVHIRFSAALAGATDFIIPLTPLPVLVGVGTWLDGTDPSGNPVDIFIDGQHLAAPILQINANNVMISNLKFGNGDPTDAEIAIMGGHGARIVNNRISSYYFNDGPCSFHVRNPGTGIRVESASGNSSPGGGTAYIYGNTIGCATSDGIKIKNGAYVYVGESSDGTLVGNFIGLDSDNHPMSNTVGIEITASSFNRIVYNRIVRNNTVGVYINSDAAFNTIAGNMIRQQTNTGVVLDDGAHGNLIGSPLGGPTTLGNQISANGRDGISLSGVNTLNNWVFGNKIGTNYTGVTADGNAVRGVVLDNGAHNNLIGIGDTERNIISGNSSNGVDILNGAHDNSVSGNYIGTDKSGGLSVSNLSGIALYAGAHDNLIGGTSPSRQNLISGNRGYGIYIGDNTTSHNAVYGNTIGTDSKGTAANPNALSGVMLDNGTHNNQIGATNLERNTISGNTLNGVDLTNGAHDNSVSGNYIGVDSTGIPPLSNLSGIALYAGAHDNLIGGAINQTQNLIGGNRAYGIYVGDSNTATNTITYNGIGYNVVGNSPIAANASDNIILTGGTHDNIIGGDGAKNGILYSPANGIHVTGGAQANQIRANYIGFNHDYGVLLDGNNTHANVISHAAIYNNGTGCPGCDGIGERNGAGANSWTEVSIIGNAGLGIDKNASSNATNIPDSPLLAFKSINRTTGVISGTGSPAVLGFSSTTIEVYRIAPDPSGFGEGWNFVMGADTNAAGVWTVTDPQPLASNGCYTAIETTWLVVLGSTTTSSEFSHGTCSTYLPLIRR